MRFSLVPIDLYPSEVHSSTGELLFLSLLAYGGLRTQGVDPFHTFLPFGGSAYYLVVGGVPDFTLELFRISIDMTSIGVLDLDQVRTRRSLGLV